ncbi:helix-turn-helix domain-containing protein [Pseudonocardia parietis]|uniref:Alkylated DNA nucleotide flippase Atl1 n=1 Tax=Pseudonocardia parietis TaxID=570936 RepID=A0ABS4VM97_9PSEU|nr:alkylated DNA nucleotide flippase Atl1 [Pseudonocardia parietis]
MSTPSVKQPHGAASGPRPPEKLGTVAAEAGQVLRLVRAGYTYREIAALVGLSTTTAWRRHRWAVQVLTGRDETPLPTMREVRPRMRAPVYTSSPGRELMRLRPRPAVRCSARRKTGGPCGCWAVHGARVCRMHGGAAPQVRRAAEARHRREKARQILAALEFTFDGCVEKGGRES